MKTQRSETVYMILAAIFISSLVACNLVFQKFFSFTPFSFLDFGSEAGTLWNRFANYRFEISVGLIPYPVTFLVTDLISELYGKRKANQVVTAGLVASFFVLFIVLIGDAATATSWSPVSDGVFSQVFGLTGAAVLASMMAYLLAQYIDIRIFHFWKKLTKGKMLWLRNNFSTIPSQLIDTASVLLLLCAFGAIDWDKFWILFWSGFAFKTSVALMDTPLFYLFTYLGRRYLGIEQEISD